MTNQAPDTLSLIVCPKCGRTDRFGYLKLNGRHYVAGTACSGEPVVVKYRKAKS